MPRSYGVDVAAYQPSSLTRYHNNGAKFVLVKATEGLYYNNPVAVAQIRSAHHNHMYVHAYHFATFSNSVYRAKLEAKHFIQRAKYLNISKKRYLALDWEAGDGNIVSGSRQRNTSAIIAFMTAVKKAGWKPMLYAGASLIRNNMYSGKIVKKFGTCIWVASYTTAGPLSRPNFGYFPSMNGVAIWQFTDNWYGMNVDGNISLIDINVASTAKKQSKPKKKTVKSQKSVIKTVKVVYAPLIKNDPKWMISLRDANGHATGKFIPTRSKWKVFGTKLIHGKKYYKLGSNKQWVPAKYLKVIN